MTVLLHGRRPLKWLLPFPAPALCSTLRGERALICRDALRPDSVRRPRRARAVKECNRSRRTHQRASLDGAEHRGNRQAASSPSMKATSRSPPQAGWLSAGSKVRETGPAFRIR